MRIPAVYAMPSLDMQVNNMIEKQQSPIFSKTSNLLLWLLQHTEKYPKCERFRLAKRIEDTAFNFYEYLIEAVKSDQKMAFLSSADLELDKLRLYLRLAHNRKLADHGQYLFAAENLTEIGRLLGGWIKTPNQT